jgi:hypothetical protein
MKQNRESEGSYIGIHKGSGWGSIMSIQRQLNWHSGNSQSKMENRSAEKRQLKESLMNSGIDLKLQGDKREQR